VAGIGRRATIATACAERVPLGRAVGFSTYHGGVDDLRIPGVADEGCHPGARALAEAGLAEQSHDPVVPVALRTGRREVVQGGQGMGLPTAELGDQRE